MVERDIDRDKHNRPGEYAGYGGRDSSTAALDEPVPEESYDTSADVAAITAKAEEIQAGEQSSEVGGGGIGGAFTAMNLKKITTPLMTSGEVSGMRAAIKHLIEKEGLTKVAGSVMTGNGIAKTEAGILGRLTSKVLGTGAVGTFVGKSLGRVASVAGIVLGGLDSIKYSAYGQTVDAVGTGTGAVVGTAAAAGGGILAGIMIGAGSGTVVPIIGNIIGGIIGGVAGYFAGNAIGKKSAEAMGVENKYKAVVSLDKLAQSHLDILQEKGVDISKLSREEIDQDLNIYISMLQDKGYAVVNDGGRGGFFTSASGFVGGCKDMVGSTALIGQKYADFDNEVSVNSLLVNLENISQKQGKLTAERFEEYKKKFAGQIDALVVNGDFEGVTNPDGTKMAGNDVKKYLMDHLAKANDVGENENREKLFAGPLEGLKKFIGERDNLASNRMSGPITDAQIVAMYKEEFSGLPNHGPAAPVPQLSPEELNAIKLHMLAGNPDIRFENSPTTQANSGQGAASETGSGRNVAPPEKPKEKNFLENLVDMIKGFLGKIPVIGSYLVSMMESEEHNAAAKGGVGEVEDGGHEVDEDGEEIEPESLGEDKGVLDQIIAMFSKSGAGDLSAGGGNNNGQLGRGGSGVHRR